MNSYSEKFFKKIQKKAAEEADAGEIIINN